MCCRISTGYWVPGYCDWFYRNKALHNIICDERESEWLWECCTTQRLIGYTVTVIKRVVKFKDFLLKKDKCSQFGDLGSDGNSCQAVYVV